MFGPRVPVDVFFGHFRLYAAFSSLCDFIYRTTYLSHVSDDSPKKAINEKILFKYYLRKLGKRIGSSTNIRTIQMSSYNSWKKNEKIWNFRKYLKGWRVHTPLSQRRDYTCLSLLCRFFHGKCSNEVHFLIPSVQTFVKTHHSMFRVEPLISLVFHL